MHLERGSGHSHSENNDFPRQIREDVEKQVSVRVSNTVLSLYIYFNEEGARKLVLEKWNHLRR